MRTSPNGVLTYWGWTSPSPSTQELPDTSQERKAEVVLPLKEKVEADKALEGVQARAALPGTVDHTLVEPETATSTKTINTWINELKDAPDEPLKETFYFALEGDQTRGCQILYETNVDLVFNYGIPSSSSVAKIEGNKLEEARLTDDGELGISVIPRGLVYRNKEKPDWYKVAKFHKGKIFEELRFEFCAEKSLVMSKNENYGFNIRIDTRGLFVYSFFLEVRLVEQVDLSQPEKFDEPIQLNLDSINQMVKNFEFSVGKERQHA